MKSKILLILLSLQFICMSQPALQWANHISSQSLDGGISNTVDHLGNVYTTGMFMYSADFDPGPGVTNLNSNGACDIYITKSDPAGNLLWAKSMGSWALDISNSIFVDGQGDVYITGYFAGTVDFDPNAGVYNLTANWGYDIFVTKLNSSGNLLWARAFNSVRIGSWSFSNGIVVNKNGDVFVTGSFKDSVDFDPGIGTHFLYSLGNSIFILKLNSAGNFDSVFSPGKGQAQSIYLDTYGYIYTTGSFIGTADFDPGSATYNLTSTGEDAFVCKMKDDLSLVWVKQFTGTPLCRGNDIVVDYQSNVYTTGLFKGTVDFDPDTTISYNVVAKGLEDVYVSKLNKYGQLVWTKTIGSNKQDIAFTIELDLSNNIHIGGYYADTLDADPNSGNYNLISSGGSMDAFLINMDQTGNLICATSFGGTGSCGDLIRAVKVDSKNNLIITGQFGSAMDVDPGAGIYMISANGQSADIFNLKLSSCSYITSDSEKEQTSFELKLYPNPNTGKFMIYLLNNTERKTVSIFDVNGRCISKELFTDQLKEIDLSAHAKGLYLLEVWDDEKRITKKVLIE